MASIEVIAILLLYLIEVFPCDKKKELWGQQAGKFYYYYYYIQVTFAILVQFRFNLVRKRRKESLCVYFHRYGRCVRGDNCPYIHNPEKVAVCSR